MQKIIAGPFVGEFGWKLFCWQAHLRYLSKIGYEITVVDNPNHKILYKDFAEKFIPYQTYMYGDTSMSRMWGFDHMHQSVLDTINSHIPIKTKFTVLNTPLNCGQYYVLSFCSTDKKEYIWIPPNEEVINYNSMFWSNQNNPQNQFYEINQSFIPYNIKINNQKIFDIILHARSTTKGNSANKNWHVGNWLSLIDIIKKSKHKNLSICTIGDIHGSLSLPGIEDMRGINLENEIYMLNNAKCMIGCPSGPINLAALCSCPRVLVIGIEEYLNRYTRDWNPFNVKIKIVQEIGRQPQPNSVYSKINEILENQ